MEAVARRRAELKQEEASKADATVSTPRDLPSRSATWQMKPASYHLLTVALGCKAVLLFFFFSRSQRGSLDGLKKMKRIRIRLISQIHPDLS